MISSVSIHRLYHFSRTFFSWLEMKWKLRTLQTWMCSKSRSSNSHTNWTWHVFFKKVRTRVSTRLNISWALCGLPVTALWICERVWGGLICSRSWACRSNVISMYGATRCMTKDKKNWTKQKLKRTNQPMVTWSQTCNPSEELKNSAKCDVVWLTVIFFSSSSVGGSFRNELKNLFGIPRETNSGWSKVWIP
jgi:hypothetical protein